jgi:hypothetical protein
LELADYGRKRSEIVTTPPAEPQDTKDTLVQIYWAIFEAWSAQVNSYWTRTNYFAAFELAAIAGSWVVLDDKKLIVGHRSLLIVAVPTGLLAIALTAAWIFSNVKSYDYHIYWWSVLKTIESRGGWGIIRPDYVSEHENRRTKHLEHPRFEKWEYHTFTNWHVPIAFFVIWIGVIVGLIGLRWSGTADPVLSKTSELSTNGQWVLESYDVEKGYVFVKDGVHYVATCYFYSDDRQIGMAFTRLAANESVCTVVLPFMHKPVPLTPRNDSQLIFVTPPSVPYRACEFNTIKAY